MFYSLVSKVNYSAFRISTHDVHASPPLECDPGAPCEIHTMLGGRDLPLYLVAIKSLLRFHGAVAVVIHSDGTLDPAHSATLHRHVPGCRIIPTAEADERARHVLGEDSFLSRLRGFDPCYRRLVDTELLGTTQRRIVMDSDILVLRRPREVIDWIGRGDRPFLIGQPPASPAAGGRPRNVQAIFLENLDRVSEAVGLPGAFSRGTTAGFYGCTGELDLHEVGRVVEAALDLGLPMREWGGDQCVTVYLLSVAGADRLSPDRYLNFSPRSRAQTEAADLVHFYGTHRFYKGVYARLARRVIRDLGRAAHPEDV
jgi:hypothetical protein